MQEIINQKKTTKLLIKNIKNENKQIKIDIIELSDSITYIDQLMNMTLDTLNNMKTKIKNIIKESIINKNKPKNIEFIFESQTWDEFILHATLYDMVINKNNQKVSNLLDKKIDIQNNYNNILTNKKMLLINKRKLTEKK